MGMYDIGSKWLIENFGGSILRMAGYPDVRSWRPLQTELVYPIQTPDGLVEVELASRDRPALFLLEIATFPERRIHDQVRRGIHLADLVRNELPEAVVVVLAPRGRLRVAPRLRRKSPLGLTRESLAWRVIEMWTVPAEALLVLDDPGVLPWVPLTRMDSPEEVLRECRRRIEERAAEDQRDNLLAVSQVLATLKFQDPRILAIFGGRKTMLEIPAVRELVQELVEEARAEARAVTRAQAAAQAVLTVLGARFGQIPEAVSRQVRQIQSAERLEALVREAAVCPDLAAFRARLEA